MANSNAVRYQLNAYTLILNVLNRNYEFSLNIAECAFRVHFFFHANVSRLMFRLLDCFVGHAKPYMWLFVCCCYNMSYGFFPIFFCSYSIFMKNISPYMYLSHCGNNNIIIILVIHANYVSLTVNWFLKQKLLLYTYSHQCVRFMIYDRLFRNFVWQIQIKRKRNVISKNIINRNKT